MPLWKSDFVSCHLKQQLSLDLIKYHTIKTYGRMEVELHTGMQGIVVARSPRRIFLFRWFLVFLFCQCEIRFMSAFWQIGFWAWLLDFWKSFASTFTTLKLLIHNDEAILF